MKVLVINWRDIKNPEAGGAEIHIDEILRRKPEGWAVDFVSARFKGAPAGEDVNGYHIYRIPNNFLFNFTFFYFWVVFFSRNNYDLIIDDISKIPLATPLYIKKVPVIAIDHHIHGKSLFKELPFPLALYTYLMEKFFLSFYTNLPVIVMADSNKAELERRYNYKKVIISFTGLDYEFIRSNVSPDRNLFPTVIYFGRLKKYKRVDDVVRAFSLVVKEIPYARLWIGGKGDRENSLKEIVKELKIEQNVSFFGFVDDRKKVELISKSWIYAIASEKEGWGLTVIEANAAGTPVVGYNVEGLRDSIKEGYSGFLVENGNIKQIAEKVVYLIKNNELREKMSLNSVEWASRFSWDNTAKDFYNVVNNHYSK